MCSSFSSCLVRFHSSLQPCRLLLARSLRHREPLRVDNEEGGDEEQPEVLLICSQAEETFYYQMAAIL